MAKQHKVETRKRETSETVCVEKGCKFVGQPTAQGICFGKLNRFEQQYIDKVAEHGESHLREAKALRKASKLTTDKKWIRYLEGHLVCAWMNEWFTLHELVHLRAENSRLRLLAKRPRRK